MDESMEIGNIGRVLILVGVCLALAGLLLLGLGKLTGGQGLRLPGDIMIRRPNATIYIPIATSILLSILLTLVLWFLSWLNRR